MSLNSYKSIVQRTVIVHECYSVWVLVGLTWAYSYLTFYSANCPQLNSVDNNYV